MRCSLNVVALLAEAKNLAAQKDAQQQGIAKAREEQSELNDRKSKTKVWNFLNYSNL